MKDQLESVVTSQRSMSPSTQHLQQ